MRLRGINFSTYNCRTLFQTGKFDQLVKQAVDIPGIDIIGIQEHRWITTETTSKCWSPNHEYLTIYSSADKNRVGGIGLLVRKKHTASYRTAVEISDRLLAAHFQGNPMVAVIVAYAPTEVSDQTDKGTFYQDLKECIDKIAYHTIVLGDFNARDGHDAHRTTHQTVGPHLYHDASNDNGKRLVDLCSSTQLKIVQSYFPQRKGRLWCWEHSGGTRAQLDHILICKKWANSITNCRAYNTLELDSDHRVITESFTISFRATATRNACKRPKYNWDKPIGNDNIQQQFQVETFNK